MNLDEIKDFINKYDWQGLAEAYHKSQMSLAADEWQGLFSWIKGQEVERVKNWAENKATNAEVRILGNNTVFTKTIKVVSFDDLQEFLMSLNEKN